MANWEEQGRCRRAAPPDKDRRARRYPPVPDERSQPMRPFRASGAAPFRAGRCNGERYPPHRRGCAQARVPKARESDPESSPRPRRRRRTSSDPSSGVRAGWPWPVGRHRCVPAPHASRAGCRRCRVLHRARRGRWRRAPTRGSCRHGAIPPVAGGRPPRARCFQRVKRATDSTCAVCGNILTIPAASRRKPCCCTR